MEPRDGLLYPVLLYLAKTACIGRYTGCPGGEVEEEG